MKLLFKVFPFKQVTLSICLLSICLPFNLYAQSSTFGSGGEELNFTTEKLYHRLRVSATPAQLLGLGIDADHGIRKAGEWFEWDFSSSDLSLMQEQGIHFEMLIPDVSAYYAEQAAADPGFDAMFREEGAGSCSRIPTDFVVPADFVAGSMGGYYTMDEVYAKMDAMAASYPALVSPRTPVGSQLTHQGRQLFMVKISDHVALDETDEPNVLYTALMHAREPAGMMSVLFYMQWLLENYGIDERATYVIDRTQLYFVPVVNPDGYEINRIGNPSGGGLWRKNARNNGTTTGVDLNRNWPYEWGFDDSGSSPSSASDVYRGPSAGSEPEIMNLMELSIDRNFRTAFNYHSFGNLLIYPWGFDSLITSDHGDFRRASRAMTTDNDYHFGTPYQTVRYAVNGSSDDWFYGAQSSKDKTFSWTPEVGTVGFWPPPSQIIPMAQENALANLYLAYFSTRYALVAAREATLLTDEGMLRHSVTGYGLLPVNVQVRLEALTPNINVSTEALHYASLSAGDQREGELFYRIKAGTRAGETVRYAWVISWEGFETRQQVETVYGADLTMLQPEANWIPRLASINNGSAPLTWGDSPDGAYVNYSNFVGLLGSADLRFSTRSWIEFDMTWDLESGFDYALFEASVDGQTWEPLCGQHTRLGLRNPAAKDVKGLPLYTGSSDWTRERLDLSAYAGQQVDVRLRVVSDESNQADGVEISQPELYRVPEQTQPLGSSPAFLLNAFPNPSTGLVHVQIQGSSDQSQGIIRIVDLTGSIRKVFPAPVGQQTLDLRDLPGGLYWLVLQHDGQTVSVQRLSLMP